MAKKLRYARLKLSTRSHFPMVRSQSRGAHSLKQILPPKFPIFGTRISRQRRGARELELLI
jgi:hypothetical protein